MNFIIDTSDKGVMSEGGMRPAEQPEPALTAAELHQIAEIIEDYESADETFPVAWPVVRALAKKVRRLADEAETSRKGSQ